MNKRQLTITAILLVATVINQMYIGDYTKNICFYLLTIYVSLTIPSFIKFIKEGVLMIYLCETDDCTIYLSRSKKDYVLRTFKDIKDFRIQMTRMIPEVELKYLIKMIDKIK